ncbi:TetR/AcrR family transcriptional regulator [Candidatus Uabimicrobium amorphum]|uniref:TetR family transcriptional regulator n=1 Tax=Uabimicrobium amorphum TaxID=2596890 RepID=A0A5S9IPY4_UABAM|nr:TetR/AcrR family transcriptional regulator [Candidatus Uabimicrobium amorphum]BBM85943.1 TetR family transcriptional regulator [Candidatus Uabimicrobium amorphum]
MKKTKKHWFEVGIDILGESGEKQLTIDCLCQKLQMTKGSFYHHFTSRKKYIHGLLEYWSQRYTTEIISSIEKIDAPTLRAHELIRKVLVIPQKVEMAIRVWASQNEAVHHFQQQVDDMRIQFLETYLHSISDDKIYNKKNAKLIYTCYIGCQHLLPRISHEEYIEILNHLLTIVGLPPYFDKDANH